VVERLTDLMHAEAYTLDIPTPPTATIVREGRRLRRTRVAVPTLKVAAAAAAVSALVLVPGLNSEPDDPTVTVHERQLASFTSVQAAAAERTYADSGAFAVGTEIYFGDFPRGVDIDDKAVRGLYYTSAGVLVQHGKNYAMDGSSRDEYSLVGTDGSVKGLNLALGDVSPSTDAKQPYLAYAREAGKDWEVVVLDLRDGKPVAVLPVAGSFSSGGWDAPPVALSGDLVYVALDDETVALNWRTGDVTGTDLPSSRYPDINAGRYLQVDNDTSGDTLNASVQVLDAGTGEVLLDLPDVGDRFASLSPDGTHVLVFPYLIIDEDGQIRPMDGAVLYDVDSGRGVDLPKSSRGGYGWTPDGSVISVDDGRLVECDFAGCTTTGPPAANGETIRLGGMVNES
jgi:hypothetical protein